MINHIYVYNKETSPETRTELWLDPRITKAFRAAGHTHVSLGSTGKDDTFCIRPDPDGMLIQGGDKEGCIQLGEEDTENTQLKIGNWDFNTIEHYDYKGKLYLVVCPPMPL